MAHLVAHHRGPCMATAAPPRGPRSCRGRRARVPNSAPGETRRGALCVHIFLKPAEAQLSLQGVRETLEEETHF